MTGILDEMRARGAVSDVCLVGFIDVERGVAEFCPDLRFLYVAMGERYLAFESIEQYSKLRMSLVDELSFDFEVDDGMMRGASSVGDLVLDDAMSLGNTMRRVVLYNLEGPATGDEVVCDAVEIILENGQVLFLDPSYHFGINIGGPRQKQLWEANYSGDLAAACAFTVAMATGS